LSRIREAQALGEVKSREDAINFCRKIISGEHL